MAAGVFITFEGGEGAGKSAHIGVLARALENAGVEPVVTREPGGTEGAEAIRALLVSGDPNRWDAMSEALLHIAARRDHVARKIAPALDDGRWVLCDRFMDSTVAYQGYGHELGADAIDRLHALALPDIAPDLTFMLDVPVEEGLSRAGRRRGGETRYERMATAFHERVRAGFLAIAAATAERCVVIDTTQPRDTVAKLIWSTVAERFSARLPQKVAQHG